MRKKIVLSNSNALEVEGMPDITAEMMVDADLQGRVVGIPSSLIERLLVVDAFKPTQRWRLFRRPGTLIRKETVQYGKLFEKMSEEGEKQSLRRIFVGERGSGKTVMLLQAMTMAFLKDWVVINFPDAQEIVIGHTEYAPIPETSPTLYAQREYVAKLLSTIARANPILQTINLSSAPDSSSVDAIPIPIPPSISLSRLALLGSQDRESALQIFDLLIQELSLPERPRLLICLDGLGHVMKDSVYKTPAFKPVHAHELAIVDWFMRYLSGASPLPNGGMVLAATSESNIPNVTTLNVALTELEEAQSGAPPRAGSNALVQPYRPPLRNPFTRYDERVLSLFDSRSQSLEVQRIGGMTKEETRGLLEYYARSGILRQRVNEGLVAEKWSVSGGGVVGEMERASILMKL
ncbi:37S ribosomal protein S23 mitochondrial [Pseudocyphellaria aurata]|nr:37S ribosomal protein S23 mitochondrial [Pseudocyphellaria aurata]